MNPETLEALKGSIEKWRTIVEENGYDEGTANCPLCRLFRYNDCVGCPVSAATGNEGCHGSPYDNWFALNGHQNKADIPGRFAAARAELDFLRSLLPKEEASE